MDLKLDDDIPNENSIVFDNKRRGNRNHKGRNEDLVSIEEALVNIISDNSYMPLKTPVSILQELLSRRGITPSYELVQIEGAIHEPTFRYRVSFADKDALGAGRSKKDAKHAAAKNLIDKLSGATITDLPLCVNGIIPTNNESTSFEDKVSGNPIGWLQELCMARRWPPPVYDMQMEVGLPHERLFTIACCVVKHREIGQGKSKKIAKRFAAQKMWTQLQKNPPDPDDLNQVEDGGDEINRVTNILNRYADLKDSHIPTSTNEYSFKVSQFHKNLKSTHGKTLAALQTICLNNVNVNYTEFLQTIAIEQHFEVTYVDVEERSYSGRFQCLIQLSTLPVAVCQGAGVTTKDAQSNAARTALEYLKIMTKK